MWRIGKIRDARVCSFSLSLTALPLIANNTMTEPSPTPCRQHWHPFDLMKDKNEAHYFCAKDEEVCLDLCREYLKEEAVKENCTARTGTRAKLSCSCMKRFRDNAQLQEAVSRFMIYFFRLTKSQQQLKVMELNSS